MSKSVEKSRRITVMLIILQVIVFGVLVFGREIFPNQNLLLLFLLIALAAASVRMYYHIKKGFKEGQ
jgi:hypothetical protein